MIATQSLYRAGANDNGPMSRHRLGPALVLVIIVAQQALGIMPGAGGPEATAPRAAAGVVVLFDEAHFPVYTVNPANPSGYGSGNNPQGAYAAFAGVMTRAGMTVRTLDYGGSLNATTLSGVSTLVIACSRGKDPTDSVYSPYTTDEVSAVVNYVRGGGGLLLIGDHTDFPPAIFPISDQFGVKFGQALLRDPTDYVQNASAIPPVPDPSEGPVFIVFGQDNFNNHPIMDNITRVELYRTDIFAALPAEAQPLITSDADTYIVDGNGNSAPAPRSVVSAAIPSNGTAGAGRIVVVADTNTFETDENRDGEDTDMDLFDSDNARYGTQIVEWLSGIPAIFGVELVSAEKGTIGQKELGHECDAGRNTTFYLQVKNGGNRADSFDIVLSGATSGWTASTGISSVTLKMDDSRIFPLEVSVPPAAAPGSGARFRIDAVSRGDPSVRASMNCTVQVPVVHDITLTCADNRRMVHAGETAEYRLVLGNRGNMHETVWMSAPGPDGWETELDMPSVEMDAGTTRNITLRVTPPAGALGGAVAKIAVGAETAGPTVRQASAEVFTTVIQAFCFTLSCPAPFQAVDPGSLVSFPVLVTNNGNGDDQISLTLAGGGKWGGRIEPAEVSLPWNSTVQAAVVARAPPNSPAGERLELEARGMSVREPTARANISLAAQVNRMGKFQLGIEPPTQWADPGGVAEFNVTVTNIGNAGDTILLATDKPARLSRDEVTLEPGASMSVRLVYQVDAGEPAGAQHLVEVTGTSSANSSVWSSAGAVVVVNHVRRVVAALSPDALAVAPGGRGECVLSVDNGGNGPESVSVRIERVLAGWGRTPDSVLAIGAGGSGRRNLSIEVPAGTAAGANVLQVNVSWGAGLFSLLPLTVDVPRVLGFDCSVQPPGRAVLPGREANFTILLDNTGNSPENISLSGTGRLAGWVLPAERTVTVNRSGTREVRLGVRPGPGAVPGRYTIGFAAVGEGNDSRNVLLNLTVKEAATGSGEFPCLAAAAVLMGVAAVAWLARRRLARTAGASAVDDAPSRVPAEAPEGPQEGTGEAWRDTVRAGWLPGAGEADTAAAEAPRRPVAARPPPEASSASSRPRQR